jgi:tetratricopeptide (TPR) repeat protein
MTEYCSSCGSELAVDAKFCNWCGQAVAAMPEKEAPSPEESSSDQAGGGVGRSMGANCPSCGTPVGIGASRCTYCGSLMGVLTSREHQEARLKELRQALGRRKPTFAEALGLGELCLALGWTAHAEEYLRQAVELDPAAARPRLLLCLSLLGLNQPRTDSELNDEEIKGLFSWLQENHPELPEIGWLGYYLELNRLLRAGDWRGGIECAQAAKGAFPENYVLRFMYGLALVHFGDTKGLRREDYMAALREMRMSAELNPNFEPAVKNIRALAQLAAEAPP